MKKGFTLIELLAVIVILAIIALIATPIVINIISDTKVSTIKRSSELYIDAIELTLAQAKMDNIDLTTCNKLEDGNLICGENPYKVEIKGRHPEYIEVKATQKGEVSFAMKTDGYCIMRTEDESISYKKIVSSVNNSEKEIKEEMCSLNPYTSSNCFAFDSETGTITKYYNNENNDPTQPACPKDVVIPKKINGVEVRIIGKKSFYNIKLTNVEFPVTVITIEQYSFWRCNLASITIPEGVTTIGAHAFFDNNLMTIKLPSTLTSIASNAFQNNKLPQDQAYFYKRNSDGSIDYTTIIGYGGSKAEGGKDIVIPSRKNGIKLTTIGNSAFYNAGLTSVEIPNTVVTIDNYAFRKNGLTTVKIPEGVTTIEQEAFANNKLTELNLPSTLTTIGARAFYDNKLKEEDAYFYKRNSDGSIDYSTIIEYGGELKDIIIPSRKNGIKLTTIGNSAFYNAGLTSVEIPNTVVTIDNYAFRKCNLTNITIPQSVTTIGIQVFNDNPLESITIKNKQENVTIGPNTFGTFDINKIVWNQ